MTTEPFLYKLKEFFAEHDVDLVCGFDHAVYIRLKGQDWGYVLGYDSNSDMELEPELTYRKITDIEELK